jgi:NAD(P)-dependent dehydrogenase (short-subunit alcohol dehydrogenase family)
MYPDLNNKTILITGGANGIGEAMVRAFTAQNARVHFCDIDEKGGAALQTDLPGNATFSKVDLTDTGAIKSWINSTTASGDTPVHTLINNAARDPRISLEEMTPTQWDDLIALNLRAYFFTAQAAVPHMPVDGTGSIINFSSITAHIAPPDVPAYVATKSGIIGLTRSLARSLGAEKHIRVNTISPGWIMTERQCKEFVTREVADEILGLQAIPKLLQPDDIADVALFLASSASRALTGQELIADRGWAHP